MEQIARWHAADVGTRLVGRGWSWHEVARLFRLPGRTLRHWCCKRLHISKIALPLGRPVERSSREVRNTVIHFLDEVGPQVGVPTLRDCFPSMSRSELADLLRRYRRVWRMRNKVPLRVLHWLVPGRVWAIDFSGPLPAIDGRYSYLLAVRDLATGRQLLWQPAEAATAEVARDALATLFAEHGAPLVLKRDNGSAFIAGVTEELLEAYGVVGLFSPPYWPRYNGAVEAGIGSLKGRTEARAARVGHPGYWTWDDVEAARSEANVWARPFGPTGPSPDEAWSSRTPITSEERAAFRASVKTFRHAQQIASGACAESRSDVSSEREMARSAIRLALEERGYLQYRRRRIPPPINAKKTANIP
jgi:transposase InsO family protein